MKMCLLLILLCHFLPFVHSQAADPPPVTYPASIPVQGLMNRTDVDLEDGFAIDLLSPSEFTLFVNKSFDLVPPFVVSTGGGSPWVHVNNFSWVITTDRAARDVVGKVEAPYVPEDLAQKGVAVENTYVGRLSDDGTHWVVDESTRNVHVSENVTRIIKMSDMTGTYALLGRQTGDSANIFIQFAFGDTRTFNVTAGSGAQNGQFIDGFEIQASSSQDLRINVNVQQPIESTLPQNSFALTKYSYLVNCSLPTAVSSASILLPFTDFLVQNTNQSSPKMVAAYREATSTGSSFTLFTNSTIDLRRQLVSVSGINAIAGEWVIAVSSDVS